jgi:hypothetical protein
MTSKDSESLLSDEQLHFKRLNDRYTKLTVGLSLSIIWFLAVSLWTLPFSDLGLGWISNSLESDQNPTIDEFLFENGSASLGLWLFYLSFPLIFIFARLITKREQNKVWGNNSGDIDSTSLPPPPQ